VPAGDYESLRVITSIDPKGYRIIVSGEAPSDDGHELVRVSVGRRVLAADQAGSLRMRSYFRDDDDVFPGTAEEYGIYFSFNRADLRPESDRTLDEIAAILKAYPQWKLRIDGQRLRRYIAAGYQ